jgi:MYXO-CTERM domain-containing protein
VPRDFAAVRRRLLADFPAIVDVMATTAPATVLVIHREWPDADAWLAVSAAAAAARRRRSRHVWHRRPRPERISTAA